DAGLAARVAEAGVTTDKAEHELAVLRAPLAAVRARLQGERPGFAEARGAATAVAGAELSTGQALIALRARYRPPEHDEIRLRWADLVEPIEVSSAEELRDALERLRGKIAGSLVPGTTVMVE